MVAKTLDFWLSENLKIPTSEPFALPIYPQKVEFCIAFPRNILEYLPNKTIGISIILYLIPQCFSWLKNYTLHGFSNSCLTLFSLMAKQLKSLLTRI